MLAAAMHTVVAVASKIRLCRSCNLGNMYVNCRHHRIISKNNVLTAVGTIGCIKLKALHAFH
jgi:hypothetical protein